MSSNQNDHNKGGMAAFMFSMVFTIGFFIYVTFMTGGVNLKEVADVDEKVANPIAAVDEGPKKIADIAAVKEPWLETPELTEHGHYLYKLNCVMCHGEKGLGDGVAGAALNPKPRNLVEGQWRKGGSSIELFTTLTKGLPPGMPGFAHMAPGDRWALVQYIHSITQSRVKDNLDDLKAKAPGLK